MLHLLKEFGFQDRITARVNNLYMMPMSMTDDIDRIPVKTDNIC